MKKAIKIVAIILLVFFISALLAGPSGTTNKKTKGGDNVQEVNHQDIIKPTTTPIVKPIKVEIGSFIKEFDSNQLAAESKYSKKTIQLTGYVDNISEDILGNYFITLRPSKDKYYVGTQVQCFFDNRKVLLHIKNGEKVTVIGRFQSQDLGIIGIEHCKLKR